MQRYDSLQFVGQVCAPGRLPFAEGILLQIVGMGKMVDVGDQRVGEGLAIRLMPPTEIPPKPTP